MALELAEAEPLKERLRPGAGCLLRDASVLQRERGVVECAPPRQQEVFLGHEGAVAKPPSRRPVGTDLDRPVCGLEEARNGEEKRRLAAPARADDREPLVSGDRQVRVLEGKHVAEAVANALDDDVRGHLLVFRRYRRVKVQIPTLGCSDI